MSFALAVQQLARATEQVLVLAQVAAYRAEGEWFDQEAVDDVFRDLRVPRPDTRRALRQLKTTGHVVTRDVLPTLSLSPLGRVRVRELFGTINLAALEPELVRIPGASLGSVLHATLPPEFAPLEWRDGIARMLGEYPFESNVFCMTRFPDDGDPPPEVIATTIVTTRSVLREHGLTLHLASDRQIADDLWGNVAAHAWACRYGIGLVEDRVGDGINYNLVSEVGSMLMTGRRCAILKDSSAPDLPTNFIGRIYKSVDFGDQAGVETAVHRWASRDLGLGSCSGCVA
jgi:hypothetical protein